MCRQYLRGQKRVLDALELKLQTAVSYHVVLEIEPGSQQFMFLTAESSLQHQHPHPLLDKQLSGGALFPHL